MILEYDLFFAGKFLLYILFMFLTFTYFTFYGMMAVGLTPTQHMAAIVSSAFYSLWNLFNGFLVPKTVSNDSSINGKIVKSNLKNFSFFLASTRLIWFLIFFFFCFVFGW